MKPILCIRSFPNRIEAELAKSLLTSAGILSFIQADDAGGAYPFPLSGHMKGVQVFVKVTDAPNARIILEQHIP